MGQRTSRPANFWVTLIAWIIAPLSAFAQADWSQVKPVLDKRCVVCHGCYDAPCQVKLTSPEGLLRGGNKLAVYHSQRLEDAQPTRLGQDATTVEGWRDLGFHPVLPQAQGETSLLDGTVSLAEPLGHETLLYVETPSGEVISKADGRTPPGVGSRVALHALKENLHLFDAETEQAIT